MDAVEGEHGTRDPTWRPAGQWWCAGQWWRGSSHPQSPRDHAAQNLVGPAAQREAGALMESGAEQVGQLGRCRAAVARPELVAEAGGDRVDEVPLRGGAEQLDQRGGGIGRLTSLERAGSLPEARRPQREGDEDRWPGQRTEARLTRLGP